MRILNFGSLNIDYVYGVDHFAAKGQTITSHALDVFPEARGPGNRSHWLMQAPMCTMPAR